MSCQSLRCASLLSSFLYLVLAFDAVAVAAPPAPPVFVDSGEIRPLPPPRTAGGMALDQVLASRRSQRSLASGPLTLAQLSQLLWAAQGVTDEAGHRTVPSAMATYPLDLFVVAGQVDGLTPGLWHYLPGKHALALHRAGDHRKELVAAALPEQSWVAAAPAILVASIVPARVEARTGPEPALRYALLEAGAAGQAVLLEAVALGLGSTYVGGIDQGALARFLGLPPGMEPVACWPVGRPAR